MSPDASLVRAFLARTTRRLTWLRAEEGAAAGLLVALSLRLAGWPARGAPVRAIAAGFSLALVGSAVNIGVARIRRRRVAHVVERRAPECRNLLVTADEVITRHSGVFSTVAPVSDYVGAIICRRAAQLVGQLDLAALFPARRTAVALCLSIALWATAVARAAAPSMTPTGTSSEAAAIATIDVTITPPAYAGERTESLRDPARIEALAGSRVRLTVHVRAARVTVETLHGVQPLAATTDPSTFAGDLLADADGYIAVEPATADGHAGGRRLIGVSVITDHPPRVRITAPARDMQLRDGHQTIDLAIEANDDIGLASLRLRYTKVSGSGERFIFTEGETPLAIERIDARTWKAHAAWRLDPLKLEQGDMIVYRAVASDYRPGAPPAESDAFIAEVIMPGAEASSGIAMDTEESRYALSQQMVILKTEKLLARQSSMAVQSYADEAADVAAEQRRVRAEFVFMMGGEIGEEPISMTELNETAEAEGEGELLAGRMVNQGRDALLSAIRSMSRADKALTTPDLPQALIHERAALVQVQRAFSHTRLILRALTEHERLDLSRRLTGVLADAARDTHPSVEPERDPRVTALRQALAGVAALAGSPSLGADASARASLLAQSVLTADPGSEALQQVATLLTNAGAAMGRAHRDEARALLDRAATGLAAVLRADLLDAPRPAPAWDVDRIAGALTDALRGVRDPP